MHNANIEPVIGLLFLVSALLILAPGLLIARNVAVSKWASVTVSSLDISITEKRVFATFYTVDRKYCVEASYDYVVNGEVYTGKRVYRDSGCCYFDRKDAERCMDEARGVSVAKCNPRKPEESVLLAGFKTEGLSRLLAPMVSGVILVIVTYYIGFVMSS